MVGFELLLKNIGKSGKFILAVSLPVSALSSRRPVKAQHIELMPIYSDYTRLHGTAPKKRGGFASMGQQTKENNNNLAVVFL